MEYGLWNFQGGFWNGGNTSFPSAEGISRNFYGASNNELETPSFHVSTHVNGDSANPFTTAPPVAPPCSTHMRPHMDFVPIKTSLPVNTRVPPMVLTGHQDDLLQAVALEGVSMASDLVTEQSSIESLTPTEHPSMPTLLSQQPNLSSNNSNSRNNNSLTNNNNSNHVNNVNDEEIDDPPPLDKKVKSKIGRRENEEVWEHVNGDGTNIKLENNNAVDYLFQQSYQNPMYGMVFSRMSTNKRETGTSDETDEDDDEVDKSVSQSRIVDGIQTTSPTVENRFRFSERNEMESHISRHLNGGCKLNGKRRTGPITPQRVRYEREEYRCQICAYSCTVEKAFYKHIKIHTVGRQMNQVKISCVICGKDRSSEVDMNKHMKKHRDDRYFCCDICIFKTVQLKKLIQHRRMHTGEKPHLCPHCSYRSARRDNLRSHVRRVHKKDNLFCDTFSPRGLLLTSTTANTSEVSSTTLTSTVASTPNSIQGPPSNHSQLPPLSE